MDNIISINSLSFFNTHVRKDEDVINTFISRKNVLKELEEGIWGEVAKSIPQHYIIIGSRGMGKSTLLRRLEISLRISKLKESFIPILFPEEQYNIDRLSKFWLNSLDALADNFEEEHNFQSAQELDIRINHLSTISDEKELIRGAYETLQYFCNASKRRAVFLIDNIDMLFDNISKDQQFTLRKMITSNASPIFVGASVQNPKESLDYDAAFYDAFDNIYLEPLSQFEMRELLLILAEKTGLSKAFDDIYNKTAQLDALHSLTGGNPRIAVFLFQLLVNGFSDKIFENLNSLLDLITPLYKSNFELLPKQAQVIVDALALNWDPCDLDELSNVTKLANNQLSSQLDRLHKLGWIERTSKFSEEKNKLVIKVKNYSVRERFFNIWYIMRRATRRQRGDLKSLTCFLETFYTPQHLANEKARIISLLKEDLDNDKIVYGLALSKAYNKEGGTDLEDEIYLVILEHTKGDPLEISKYLNPDSIPNNIYNNFLASDVNRWVKHIRELLKNGDYALTKKFIESVLEKCPNDEYVWRQYAQNYFDHKYYTEAENSFLKAIELDPNATNWSCFGVFLEDRNRFEEAEDAFKKAIALKPNYGYYSYRLGYYFYRRNMFAEAEYSLIESVKSCPDYIYSRTLLSAVLSKQDRKDEAENVLKECIKIFPKDAGTHYLLALIYMVNEEEKAISEFEYAQELDPSLSEYFYYYGRTLTRMARHSEAEMAYKRVLALDSDNMIWKLEIGRFLVDKVNKYKEAEAIFKSIVNLEKNPQAYFELGRLYIIVGKYLKAETSLKKSIKLNPNNENCWSLLGTLQFNELHDYNGALSSCRRSLEINSSQADVWEIIGDVHFLKLRNYSEAMNAYNESLNIDSKSVDIVIKKIYILRDKIMDLESAEEIFKNNQTLIEKYDNKYPLQVGIFAAQKRNFGQAAEMWEKALRNDKSLFKESHLKDLTWAIAMSEKYGFGKELLEIFEKTGADRLIRPMFEATKALVIGNPDYLVNIAVEFRESALALYSEMLEFRDM